VFKSREKTALPPANSTLQLPPPGSLPPLPPSPAPTVALDSDSVTRLLHLETPPPSCLQNCFLPAHEAITSPIFFFYNQQQQKNHCLSGPLQITHLSKKIIKIKFSNSQRQLMKSDNHRSSHEQNPTKKEEEKGPCNIIHLPVSKMGLQGSK
jgi:hypothetical protein